MNRREFLRLMGAGLAAAALPGCGNLLRGSGRKDGGSPSLAELYRWHCRTFFDFDRHLAAAERDYLAECFSLAPAWSYRISDSFEYSVVSFSHRVQGERANSSRVYAGSFERPERIRGRIRDLMERRGVRPGDAPLLSEVSGVGWDVEGDDFKVYVHLKDVDSIADPDLRALRDLVRPAELHREGLASYTLKGGKISEKKVYVGLRERLPPLVRGYPFAQAIAHTNYMITDKRGIVPQVDLQHLRDLTFLNFKGQDICVRYGRERNLSLDTLAYIDRDRFALYFP